MQIQKSKFLEWVQNSIVFYMRTSKGKLDQKKKSDANGCGGEENKNDNIFGIR
jgi:hypothetical protein